MHQNKGKSIADCLADRTDYAKNPDKTNDGELLSSYECDPRTVQGSGTAVGGLQRLGTAVQGGGAMTVKEWATDWMELCVRPTVRPTTYAAHNYIMQNHIIPGLGGLVLEELSVTNIEQFLDERKRLGSHRPESADYPGLNDGTMRHIHNLLRRCLAQAVAEGHLSENPADAFSYAKPATMKANILTATEIEDYLDAADRLGYLPMFTLELTAGLREGELIALQ